MKTLKEEIKEWASNHTDCIGHNEGQKCCLEEEVILDFLLSLISSRLPKEKEYPSKIRQEIWGGERGYPNTIIENPDVVGIENVNGYNQALKEIKNLLK